MLQKSLVKDQQPAEERCGQVEDDGADVDHDVEREELAPRVVDGPRARVDVRREHIVVAVVQYDVHPAL